MTFGEGKSSAYLRTMSKTLITMLRRQIRTMIARANADTSCRGYLILGKYRAPRRSDYFWEELIKIEMEYKVRFEVEPEDNLLCLMTEIFWIS